VLGSFSVTVTTTAPAGAPPCLAAEPTGAPDCRIPIDTSADTTLQIVAVAVGTDGQPFPAYDGVAMVTIEPGEVVSVDGQTRPFLRFTKGTAAATVVVRLVTSHAAVWLQDANPGPLAALEVDAGEPPPGGVRCGPDDGFDDLADWYCPEGTFCLRDLACGDPGATQATGASSPILYFENPTIADVQFPLSSDDSPYEERSVEIDDARCDPATGGLCLVVVSVSSDGFYVTDVGMPAGSYNSIFAFNFSQPEDLTVGDVLRRFGGGVGEFIGFTELNFPNFEVKEPGRTDLLPAPGVIDSATLGSNALMEAWEASLVALDDVSTPSEFRDCDFNEDGQVEICFFFDPCTPGSNEDLEDDCAFDCQNQPGCSDLTAFIGFGQYTVTLAAGGEKANLVTRTAMPSFDPAANCAEDGSGGLSCAPFTLDRVVGTVRQVTPARPRWIVEPRSPDDLCFSGTACP